MRVTDELDITFQIEGNLSPHSRPEPLDELRTLHGEHVVKIVLVTVLNIDASRDEKAFVKDIILGVGLVDPVDRHIRVSEESGPQLLVKFVLLCADFDETCSTFFLALIIRENKL